MKMHQQRKCPFPVIGTRLREAPGGTQLRLFSRPAFTLVELLIVMAIVLTLFGLLAAGLSRAKMAAQRIVCLNNLKQWGCAAHLYAHDNDEQLPREAAFDGINPWEVTGSPTNSDVWYNALPVTASVGAMTQYAQT